MRRGVRFAGITALLIGFVWTGAALADASSQQKEAGRERLLIQLSRDMESVEGAVQSTRELIQQSMHRPYLPDLYLRLAELYIEKSRILYHLKRLEDPEAPKSVIVLEANLLKTKAIDLYDKILKDFPDYAHRDKVLFFMAHEYRELGRFDKMLSCYTTITTRYPKSPYRLESYLLIGDYHFDNMDLSRAEKAYRTILDAPESPVHGMARYKMAWCHINRNEHVEAFALLENLVSNFHSGELKTEIDSYKKINLRREAIMDLAYCYTEVKPPDEALEYFAALADSKNLYLAVLDKLAGRYFLKEEWAASAGVYREILSLSRDQEKNGEYADRLFACAQKALNMARPEGNVRVLVQTLESLEASWRIPDDEKERQKNQFELYARDLATRLHLEAKKKEDKNLYSQAADAYASYLAFFEQGEQAVELLHNQAESLHEAGRYFEAASAYERLAALEPGEAEGPDSRRHNLYGAVVSYYKALKEGQGLDDLQKVEAREGLRQTGEYYLTRYPLAAEAPEVAFNVAWVSYGQGDYGAALPQFKTFVQRYPQSKEAQAAAHLALDIQKTMDNLEGLIADARGFLANEQITDSAFRKEIEAILVATEQRHMEELTVKVKDGVEGSDQVLLALGSEARDAGMQETAFYNLFVVSKQEEQIPRVLEVGGQVLEKFPESEHRGDIVSTMAHFYLKAADFPNAARFSEQAAKQADDKQKQEHLLRAARLYGWMGEPVVAVKNYRNVMPLLTGEKRLEATQGLLQEVEALKDWSQVASLSRELSREEPEEPEWIFRYGSARLAQGRTKEALDALKKVRVLFGKKVSVSPEAISARERALAAQARFLLAEKEVQGFEKISFQGKVIDDAVVKKKLAGLQSVEAAGLEVAQYASPRWTIAALDLTARANKELARFFLEAPVPGGLTLPQKQQYRQLLEDKVRPYRDKARQYRQAAMEKAYQLGVFSPEVRLIFASLNNGVGLPSMTRGKPVQDPGTDPQDTSRLEIQKKLYADPENPQLLKSLAKAWMFEGRMEPAALVLHRCLEQNPDDAWVHNMLGLVRLHKGEDQEAFLCFRKALECDPALREARANLVVLYQGYGNEQAARETLVEIRTDPNPVHLDKHALHPGFHELSGRLDAVALQTSSLEGKP